MVKAKPESEPKSNGTTEKERIEKTLDDIVTYALELPGVEESTSYGQPAVKRNGKLLFALRKDQETLSLACGFEARKVLLTQHPELFFVTDHYLNYPMCVVRLGSVKSPLLRKVVKAAWSRLVEDSPEKTGTKTTGTKTTAARAGAKAKAAAKSVRPTARRR